MFFTHLSSFQCFKDNFRVRSCLELQGFDYIKINYIAQNHQWTNFPSHPLAELLVESTCKRSTYFLFRDHTKTPLNQQRTSCKVHVAVHKILDFQKFLGRSTPKCFRGNGTFLVLYGPKSHNHVEVKANAYSRNLNMPGTFSGHEVKWHGISSSTFSLKTG